MNELMEKQISRSWNTFKSLISDPELLVRWIPVLSCWSAFAVLETIGNKYVDERRLRPCEQLLGILYTHRLW